MTINLHDKMKYAADLVLGDHSKFKADDGTLVSYDLSLQIRRWDAALSALLEADSIDSRRKELLRLQSLLDGWSDEHAKEF